MSGASADRRRDRRIRTVVYGALAALLAVAAAAYWYLTRPEERKPDVAWADVDYASLPEVQLLQDYVRIDTSPTTGSEVDGALFLAEKLEAAGLETHIERLGDSSANLWAILEGHEREAVVLHNHIDVYPVEEPERWDHPPFGAELDKAWIYGRGVFDMKSVAVAQLLALIDLKQSGTKPRKSVVFLATGSEEVGSELGTRWILERHPELTGRFWAVLSEGGVVEPVNQETIKYWGIEFAQKRFADVWACSSDRGRLEEMRQDLERWDNEDFSLVLVPEVTGFLTGYAGSRTLRSYEEILSETQVLLRDPFTFRELPGYLQALFRSEAAPFPVEEAPGGGYRMRIVFQLLPGADFDEAVARLLPKWATHGVSLSIGRPLGAGHGSPVDHEAFTAQIEVLRDSFPEAPVGPYFLAWSATDSRFFRQHGIPSYGFSPFLIFNTDTFRADSANERISLPGYVRGIEVYKDLLRRVAN